MVHTKKIRSGGLTLPIRLRRKLGLREGVSIRIEETQDGGLLLLPMDARCSLCDGAEGVVLLKGTRICKTCAREVLERKEEGHVSE